MKYISLLILLWLVACASVDPSANKKASGSSKKIEPEAIDTQTSDQELLVAGAELLARGRAKQAMDKYFTPLIERCDATYKHAEHKVYGSRSLVETIYYLALAKTAEERVSVVSPLCGDAFYFKGYASLELGKIEEATELLQRAVDWSPVNAVYLSELAHMYQAQKNWPQALSTFRQAEKYAADFSPESTQSQELARAKRGVGFTLIEMGKLAEAEVKFKECLDINKKDAAALSELKYIDQLKRQAQ